MLSRLKTYNKNQLIRQAAREASTNKGARFDTEMLPAQPRHLREFNTVHDIGRTFIWQTWRRWRHKLSLPPQCELQQEHFSLQIKTSEINQLGLSENGIFQKSHGLTNDHMFSFQMAIGGAPHAHASCGHFEAKQQP